MPGSLSEADDAVQEAWLQLSRSSAGGVENLGGWLTTFVARVCLDMLRSRRWRPEETLGLISHRRPMAKGRSVLWHDVWHDGPRSPRSRSVLSAMSCAISAGGALGGFARRPRNA